ncbi:MAG TPA: HAD family phosphatase [Candidatus Saccharimonadales bacterium]|nr:HAD family phosphatase [Candidatus Saccharimonadales bacterium]
MIRAIIFDFFGVLATDGISGYCHRFFHGDKAKLKQVDDRIEELNRGRLSYPDFITKLAGLARISEEEVRSYLDANHPNHPLIEYIGKELKPHYKLGIISNAGADWVEEIIGRRAASMFDDIVLSHAVGIAKPEPAIYQISLDNLGVSASQAVFVDDVERYCEGARSVGMEAIRYRGFSRMKTELESIIAGRI